MFLSVNSNVIHVVHDSFSSPGPSSSAPSKDNSALDLLGQLYDSDETNDDTSDDVLAITGKDNNSFSSNQIIATEKLTQSLDIGEMITVMCSSIHLTVGFQRCYEWPFHSSSATALTTQNPPDVSSRSKRFMLHSVIK